MQKVSEAGSAVNTQKAEPQAGCVPLVFFPFPKFNIQDLNIALKNLTEIRCWNQNHNRRSSLTLTSDHPGI